MPNQTRLARVEMLSHRQERILRELNQSEGLCTCGRPLGASSPKFVLCNAILKHPVNPSLNGGLIMAAYCLQCFSMVNDVLKVIKGSYKFAEQAERPTDPPRSH